MPSFLSSDRLEVARHLEGLRSLKPTLCAYIEGEAKEAQFSDSPHKRLHTATLPTKKESLRLSILNEGSDDDVARADWSCWGARPKVVWKSESFLAVIVFCAPFIGSVRLFYSHGRPIPQLMPARSKEDVRHRSCRFDTWQFVCLEEIIVFGIVIVTILVTRICTLLEN